jgi:hypothetical protein
VLRRIIEFGALLNQQIVFVIDHSAVVRAARTAQAVIRRQPPVLPREIPLEMPIYDSCVFTVVTSYS